MVSFVNLVYRPRKNTSFDSILILRHLTIILLIPFITFGQKFRKTNLEIFEEVFSDKIEMILLSQFVNRDKPLTFVLTSADNSANGQTPEEIKFLRNVVKKISIDNKLSFNIADGTMMSDSNMTKISIHVKKLETIYTKFVKNRFLGEKTIERNLKGEANVIVSKSDGTPLTNENIFINFHDVIPLDNYEQLESTSYRFTQGTPPDISTIEQLVFPVILVAASAAAILAFFIIRTK